MIKSRESQSISLSLQGFSELCLHWSLCSPLYESSLSFVPRMLNLNSTSSRYPRKKFGLPVKNIQKTRTLPAPSMGPSRTHMEIGDFELLPGFGCCSQGGPPRFPRQSVATESFPCLTFLTRNCQNHTVWSFKQLVPTYLYFGICYLVT